MPQGAFQRESAELVDIFALEADREELMATGVMLGRFDAELQCFERCLLTPLARRRLIALGNKYMWDAAPTFERGIASADLLSH